MKADPSGPILDVLHTTLSLDPAAGGTSRTVSELAIAISSVGVKSTVWTPRDARKEWCEQLDEVGVSATSRSFGPWLRSPAQAKVLHCHGIWSPFHHRVARLAIRQGVPLFVSPHGMLEPWALNHHRWRKSAAWYIYQRRDLTAAATIHATAKSEAEQIRNLGFDQPICVIPNGVAPPPPGLQKAAIAKLSVRDSRSGGLPNRKRTAIFLSRFHPKKGLPMLAEAWRRVRPEGWRLLAVGPDEDGHRHEIESLVAKLGIAEDWEFRDMAPWAEKWRLLANADLFVLPTHSENFGNVVAEALIAGTPALTTTGAPWSELVQRRCGWWVEPDVDAIADALKNGCSQSQDSLNAMGRRGREWASAEFAWEGIARRMRAAYAAVLEGSTTADYLP